MRTLLRFLQEKNEGLRGQKIFPAYMTSRLSNKGTISSTNVFGVFPSAVKPVAQF